MTTALSQAERERRAIESLLMLALTAEEQIAQLPAFVVVADEVASLIDDAARLLPHEPRFAQLVHINSVFDDMMDDEDLWSVDALKTAPAWEAQRNLARAALQTLGIAERAPKIDWITFVK